MPVVVGCPYVSRSEIEDQLELRDDDGDGYAVDEDCDDTRADVHPGQVEVPYDGVDNDCAEGDEDDVDGDGAIGCVLVDGACDPSASGAPPDCDDDDPAIYPGATDEPYDGVDSDCRNNHDYDLDSDGFASDDVAGALLDAYEAETGLTAGRGDCLDTNATAFPGASGDQPYDGLDTDCDGSHDFDVDGDGYIAPEDDSSAARAVLERYLEELGDPIPDDNELDCDDSDADVNPGETEVFYDGLDADCDGGNDYDQDGDGYEVDDDCASDAAGDLDPLRSPGQVELLGTPTDDDCWAEQDARWGGADEIWDRPRSLSLVYVGDRFVMGLLLDGYDSAFATVEQPSFALFNFDDQGAPAEASSERVFQSQPVPARDGMAVRAVGLDLEVAVAQVSVPTTTTWLHRFTLAEVGVLQTGLMGPSSVFDSTIASAPVAMDATEAWTWSCGDGSLLGADLYGARVLSTPLPSEPRTCFAEATSGDATVCLDGGCQTYRANGLLLEPVTGREGFLITDAVRADDVWTFIDDGMVVVEGASVTSEPALHAAFATDGADVYGILDGEDGLELLHGLDGQALERVALDPGLSEDAAVTDVGLALSDDRVFVVVVSDANDVRWASWQR